MRSLGLICLAAYLILVGLDTLFSLHFQGENVFEGLLALAAGVLILLGAVSWPARADVP